MYTPKREKVIMPKFTVSGRYAENYQLTIEAPDEDTAVQIFYQKGGGDPIDGYGWDDIEVDFNDDENDEPDYTEEDYSPSEGKIRW
jgi:hypothetical protein